MAKSWGRRPDYDRTSPIVAPQKARHRLIFRNCHEVVMHLSRLPISLSEVTISSPRASAGVAIPTPNEAMNLPGVMRRMPSGVNEVVFVEGRFHDYAVDVARALRVDVVLSRAVLAEIYDWRAGRTPPRTGPRRVRSRSSGLQARRPLARAQARSCLHNPAEQDGFPRCTLEERPVSERVNGLLPPAGAVNRHHQDFTD